MPVSSNSQDAIVYVVDDDPMVRASLTRMFASIDLAVATFETAEEFLRADPSDGCGCLILDVQLPNETGMELQQDLVERGIDLPIIFLTGHGDIPMTVKAMRSGALDFLTKPVDQDELIRAVQSAIDSHRAHRAEHAEQREFRLRYEALSPREQEVLSLAIRGLLNKQIARRLGITERTVKEHRGRAMKKTGFHSIAELARLYERAGIEEMEDESADSTPGVPKSNA